MISDNDYAEQEQTGVSDAGATVTPLELRSVMQDLLKFGYIESSRKPALFGHAMRLRNDVNAALDPLDLTMKLDELRGLAILRVADGAEADVDREWEHPLVRRQRLTLEQSFLVAVLRQFYLVHERDAGIGAGPARVQFEDVLAQVNAFLGDTGSDSRNEQRLQTMLDKLKDHGLVLDPDKNGDITIRPLITHLANPETLSALLRDFRAAGRPCDADAADAGDGGLSDERG